MKLFSLTVWVSVLATGFISAIAWADSADPTTSSDSDAVSDADANDTAPVNTTEHSATESESLQSKFARQGKIRNVPVSVMHPPVEPLNSNRQNAFFTHTEIDAATTCGNCHDTTFITENNTHHFSDPPNWAHGDVTIDCFDCHVPNRSGWTKENADIFGKIDALNSGITRATSAVCAKCHGIVETGVLAIPEDYETRVRDEDGYLTYDLTRTTGAFFSEVPLSKSQLNIQQKEEKHFPADVHAARLLGCADCHHTGNNPAKSTIKSKKLRHMKNDPRKQSFSDYLKQPDHRLAMPRCTDCHDAAATHDFLPYKTRHLDVLDCQSCHVPRIYGPALSVIDESVVTSRGGPVLEYAEKNESNESLNARLTEGVSPSLLPYRTSDGESRIGAFNFVANWYWINDANGRRVPPSVLKKVFLQGGQQKHRAEVVSLFDSNGNGRIDGNELLIRTEAQNRTVATWLKAAGIVQPRLIGQIDVHSIAHGIMHKEGVSASCDSCHDATGRLGSNITITQRIPSGAHMAQGENVAQLTHGSLTVSTSVDWERRGIARTWYVFGHSRTTWSDTGGFIIFILSFLGVLLHGSYRIVTRPRRQRHLPAMKQLYMYSLYERIWHWLMAASVIVLLITGLKIHFPLAFSAISFPVAVTVHNITAIVLVVNAGLSLFFHVASAAILQFIPEKNGLLQALVRQVDYYTRGIFLGHPHPTSKSPDKKLNPLQQLTYLGLLNVLFPLQVITGVAIWMNAGWPEVMAPLGGLTVIGPLHNLGSWLFLTFLVVHLYLTTTGHTVLSNISAMVTGFDEVEAASIKGDSNE